MKNLLLLISIALWFPTLTIAQNNEAIQLYKVKGTGQTTGHIITLSVKNNSDRPIRIKPQIFYIPSDGRYQSYVGQIPEGITILPGQSVEIPVKGYCTDISRPPVPAGIDVPNISNWVPVEEINRPNPSTVGDPVSILPHPPVPEFSVADTFKIISSRGFTRTNKRPNSGITATWPGTNIPIRGKIDPDRFPADFAALQVEYVSRVQGTTDSLINIDALITPFLDNPQKNRDATGQQVVWIIMDALTRGTYVKDDFAENVYEQFKQTTGMSVAALPEDQKEKVDVGVDQFWTAFKATGIEAKVINVPEEGHTPANSPGISAPASNCSCNTCKVVEPLRLFNAKTGTEILGNKIPWYVDKIRTKAPVVISDCPSGCNEVNRAYTLEIISYMQKGRHHTWSTLPEEIQVQGAGEIRFRMRYYCECDGQRCGEGNLERTVYLTESNDCCDRIRSQNSGELRFDFNDGSARIHRNQIILNLNNGTQEVFDFDFNLEAVFCNLNENQIYASLQHLAAQQTGNGNVAEYFNSQDISLDHPTDIADTQPWYGLQFSKNVNGQEIAIGITIDKASCKYDLQILYGDQLYEHAGPPNFTAGELVLMISRLDQPQNQSFWHQAMRILGQLSRAKEHGMQSSYRGAYQSFLQQLNRHIDVLLNDPAYASWRNDLIQLRRTATRALASGDFNSLEQVLRDMMPMFNRG